MTKKAKKKPTKNWYPEYAIARNEKRREIYNTDAEYRRKAIEASRAAYRAAVGMRTKDCRKNISKLDKIGTKRQVRLGQLKEAKTLTVLSFVGAELAKALGYSPLTVYKMQKDDRIPAPVFLTAVNAVAPQSQLVYIKEEVLAMMDVLGKHQQQIAYYRTTHIETINAMDAAVQKAREGK